MYAIYYSTGIEPMQWSSVPPRQWGQRTEYGVTFPTPSGELCKIYND
ncbi:MAG: hypothetical protein IJD28_01270 [Deferribacterales bacterium]|nr:hypothetical protein [Deferribacterales bacterium]